MAFDVKKRKRELIRENVKSNSKIAAGEKNARVAALLLFALRSVLLLFEIIYSAVTETEISIWSHLLFIPFLLILYMIYDGNKTFVYIPMLSAPIRLVYHFAVVLPTDTAEGLSALSVVSAAVLAAQFFISVFMSANTKCEAYFLTMQKINLKLRSEMINGKR